MEITIKASNDGCSVGFGDNCWPRAVAGLTAEQAVGIKCLIDHAYRKGISSALNNVRVKIDAALDEVRS